MKDLTIKKGTGGLSDDSFMHRCDNVMTGLTGNVNFPLASAMVPAVALKVKEFAALIIKSKSADKSPKVTLAKNIKRKEIDTDMTKIFKAVNGQGISDIQILTSSGFPLAKTPEPVEGLGQCQGFTLMMGPAVGECSLKVDKLKGARSYFFQYTETLTPEIENWVSIPSTDSRVKVMDLTPGVRYTFRVCGVHGKGMGPWSDYLIRFMS